MSPKIRISLVDRAPKSPRLADPTFMRAVEFMGGKAVFDAYPADALEIHAAIAHGVPHTALSHLVTGCLVLDAKQVGDAVGVSTRTLRRQKDAPDKPLSKELGGRVWKFAEILAKATEVLGGRHAAECWLDRPATGLDGRKPIDLMTTSVGAQIVDDFITRLAYGVYS